MTSAPRPVAAGYDLTLIKRVQSVGSRDLAIRFILLVTFALTFWFAFGENAILWWLASFIIANCVYVLVLRRLPDRVGPWGVLLVAGCETVEALTTFALALFLWLHENLSFNLAVFVLAIGGAVLGLSERSADAILRWAAAIWMSFVLALLPALSLLRDGTTREGILVMVAALLVLVYYQINLAESALVRRRLSAAQLATFEQARVETLGRLTGGVAHDFNNILTVIGGNLDLADEEADPRAKRHLLAEARRATERAAGVTSQLLAYSRQSVLVPADVDVVRALSRVQSFLRRLLPGNLSVVMEPEGNLPLVTVDQTRLESALINLVLNARDAMPFGGCIVVAAGLRDLNSAALPPHLLPGRYVCISVRDEGSGIDPAILPKVVEPYFTTKPVGQGSGLGLSMAKGFAEQSGGGLQIDSAVGQGTEVRLFFPPTNRTPDQVSLL